MPAALLAQQSFDVSMATNSAESITAAAIGVIQLEMERGDGILGELFGSEAFVALCALPAPPQQQQENGGSSAPAPPAPPTAPRPPAPPIGEQKAATATAPSATEEAAAIARAAFVPRTSPDA